MVLQVAARLFRSVGVRKRKIPQIISFGKSLNCIVIVTPKLISTHYTKYYSLNKV